MTLRDRLRGVVVSALVGVGSALVQLGAKLDGIDPDASNDVYPLQDPLTAESFDLLARHRPEAPKAKVNHRPLQGSARERYARARARSGI